MQTYLSFINFSHLSLANKCDFVSNRIVQQIALINKRLLSTIYEQLEDKDPSTQFFASQFSKLNDELNQLLRLEALVLFQYIKSCEEKQLPVNISANSIDQYKKHQFQIQKLVLETRAAFLEMVGLRSVDYVAALIEYDLFYLDQLVKEWSFIINEYVLATASQHAEK